MSNVATALRAVPVGGLLLVPARVATFAGSHAVRSRTPFIARDDRAAVSVTFALLAQVAMDEMILALLKRPDVYPTGSEIHRVSAELEQTLEVHRANGWDTDPLAYHQPPPPLTDSTLVRERWLHTAFERLSWNSDYRPHPELPQAERWHAHEPNRTAHALVLRHDDATRPWVVCLHGLGTGVPAADLPAFRVRNLHARGFNVVVPVLPRHGPRGAGRLGAQTVLTYDHGESVLAVAQAVWDVRRVLSWVREQGGERIALHGVSFGALVASLLAAIDDDLAAVIAGIPVVDIPAMFRAHVPWRMRRRAWLAGILGTDAATVHSVISPLSGPPLVPADRLTIYAGVGDRFVPPAQALKLAEHWEGAGTLWFPGDHIGAMWSRPVRRLVDDVLAKHLT